jgi:hypothetical protein
MFPVSLATTWASGSLANASSGLKSTVGRDSVEPVPPGPHIAARCPYQQKRSRRGDPSQKCLGLLDLRRIESKLRPSALGICLSLTAAFLRRSLKSAEAPDFLENTFRIKLVLKPF